MNSLFPSAFLKNRILQIVFYSGLEELAYENETTKRPSILSLDSVS